MYHPPPRGRVIAKVWTIALTDLDLEELAEGVSYTNQTFSQDEFVARPFKNILDYQELTYPRRVSIDSPCLGHCAGYVVSTVAQPACFGSDKRTYMILADFIYCGNGYEAPETAGTCGSVTWTDDFDVVGQIRFQSLTSRQFYCPAFSHPKEVLSLRR